VVALAVAALLAASPSLQARYDAARDVVEHSRDRGAISLASAEIARVEHADGAPRVRSTRIPELPAGWARAHPEGTRDAKLSSRLAGIGMQFRGMSAFWVHDLRTGRVASWNAEATLPAASTVKLAAFAAALRTRRRDLRYDTKQLAAWSSNLGANRIVELLGYARVTAAMRALGMTHSTYPGPYRAGTAVGELHTRVTTAHDLGRALFTLQRAALGRSSFLTRAQGRRALELLRGSLPFGDNQGLLRPWLRGVAVAQKNGWLDDARLTAAIVYRERGPLIVVVATFREGLHAYEARALGRDVLRAVAAS
jgi:Beta-lactamase enzyme family